MKITSKQIILIILVCLFLLLISGGYFLCWPIYKEFQEKKSEMEIKDEEIRLREEYLSNLETFSEKLLTYDDELSKIDSAFPVNASSAVIFNFFQKVSSENGLILTKVDMSKTQENSEVRIQEMSFSISVGGSYPAFKNFLSAIYVNSRIIEVKSISFSSKEGKDLFDFNLELKTQFYAY